MAKQIGDIKLTGTVDDICFYKMEGEYFARMKSSLNSKKFWRHKAFEGSRKSCKRFAEGNRLASQLYQTIENEKRIYRLFCFLKKRAIALLKEGLDQHEAHLYLKDYLQDIGLLPKETIKRNNTGAGRKKSNRTSEKISGYTRTPRFVYIRQQEITEKRNFRMFSISFKNKDWVFTPALSP